MKVENYKVPHSSFLSMEKDLNQITGSMLRNKNLKKLLYYTTENALSMPDLTDDQSVSLFGRNIRITPKLFIDQEIVNWHSGIGISAPVISANVISVIIVSL